MKRSDLKKNMKNFILFCAVFLAVFSLAIFLIFLDYIKPKPGSSPTPSPDSTDILHTTSGVTEEPAPSGTESTGEPEPSKTPVIIIPGTDAPVYIGISSQIDVEASSSDYIATIIKDNLMKKNFYFASSGGLDSVTDYDKAFEINWSDNYAQVRLRIPSGSNDMEDLYEELLILVYEHGAFKYTLPAGASPTPTPTPPRDNDKYSYLTINIFNMK